MDRIMITELKIENLECVKQQDNLSNVVVRASWRLFGTVDGFTDSIYGEEYFSQPDPNNFTPLENLTKEQILGWMNLDLPKLESLLSSQIEAKTNMVTIKPSFN